MAFNFYRDQFCRHEFNIVIMEKTVQRFNGTTVQRYNGTTVQRYNDARGDQLLANSTNGLIFPLSASFIAVK
jgi:hypothetical protein